MSELAKISAVVCAYNAEDSIDKCLSSLRAAGVGEIILVDGKSNDKTLKKAEKLYDKLLIDDRKGLGAARNIGIRSASLKYILNFGADNTISKEALLTMLDALQNNDKLAVSATTKIASRSYLGRSLQEWRSVRFTPGFRNVIGTPTLFHTDHLCRYEYDNRASHSDDAELCDRMARDGFKFLISHAECEEVSPVTLRSIVLRWKNYGISDYQNFRRLKKHRNISENVASIFYPLRKELLEPSLNLNVVKFTQAIPFFLLITFLRYYFWIKEVYK